VREPYRCEPFNSIGSNFQELGCAGVDDVDDVDVNDPDGEVDGPSGPRDVVGPGDTDDDVVVVVVVVELPPPPQPCKLKVRARQAKAATTFGTVKAIANNLMVSV